MNLNDVLALLPISIRGRFSSQDNAWWIRQAAACIQRIERIPVGPNRIRKAMGYQMSSGFVPKPKCLATINDAWLSGVRVTGLVDKDDRGFQMEKGAVTWERRQVIISCDEEDSATLVFHTPAESGKMPFPIQVTALYVNSTASTAKIVSESGSLPAGSDSMIGASLYVNGNKMVITGNTDPENGINPPLSSTLDLESAEIDVTDVTGQTLWYFQEDSIADTEVHVDNEQIVIAASSWNVPTLGQQGWPEPQSFTCERAHPGRVRPGFRDGWIIKSNLILEGYRALARPTSMTDELDLPDGSEDLVASYLRWRGESDMDPDSATALKCEKDFEANLQKYSVDQSQTNGESMPHAYNMSISLSRGRF